MIKDYWLKCYMGKIPYELSDLQKEIIQAIKNNEGNAKTWVVKQEVQEKHGLGTWEKYTSHRMPSDDPRYKKYRSFCASYCRSVNRLNGIAIKIVTGEEYSWEKFFIIIAPTTRLTNGDAAEELLTSEEVNKKGPREQLLTKSKEEKK